MTPRLCCLALVLAACAASADPPAKYARPELLIEASELAKPEAAKKFQILDIRVKSDYEAGHIPGAVRVDAATWARAFAAGQDPEAWTKRLGAAGLANTARPVVVYGNDVRGAASAWWLLRYWGFKDVRLLNGGWEAWQAARGPTEKGQKAAEIGRPKLAARSGLLATKQEVLKNLAAKRATVLDARSEGEYCGDVKLAKRGGAIPGSKHLEWSATIDRATQRFKAPAELAKLFEDAGIDPKRPAITYCQSGSRAAVMAFVLELMGGDEVSNYYRSWAEWGNDPKTPVAMPKKR